MFCSECGKELKDGALFCPGCGCKVEQTQAEAQVVLPEKTDNKKVNSFEYYNDSEYKKDLL